MATQHHTTPDDDGDDRTLIELIDDSIAETPDVHVEAQLRSTLNRAGYRPSRAETTAAIAAGAPMTMAEAIAWWAALDALYTVPASDPWDTANAYAITDSRRPRVTTTSTS